MKYILQLGQIEFSILEGAGMPLSNGLKPCCERVAYLAEKADKCTTVLAYLLCKYGLVSSIWGGLAKPMWWFEPLVVVFSPLQFTKILA